MIYMNVGITTLSLLLSFVISIIYFSKFDPFIMAGIAAIFFWAINKVKKHLCLLAEKRVCFIAFFLSSVFALSQIIGFNINVNERKYMGFPVTINLFVFIALFISAFVFFLLLVLWYQQKPMTKTANETAFLSSKWIFSILLFFWIIWYLVYIPGLAVGDSFNSIRMGLGDQELQNHFPIFYTLLVGTCMKIGFFFFHNYNAGLVIYSILSMTTLAYLLSLIISRLVAYGINRYVFLFMIAYYALSPAFASYSIIMWRDPWFSALLVLFALKLYAFIQGKEITKQELFKCTMLLLGICLLRNNGIYCLLIIMAVSLFSKKLKKLLPCFFITIICICICNLSIKKLGLDRDGFVEAVGIPMQQMASVVVNDGHIDEEDAEFLYQLLPREQYKELFNPFRVDEIKWAENFDLTYLNNNKEEFFTTWVHLLKPNFKLYVKQYCMSTLGFWYMGEGLKYGEFGQVIIDNKYDIHFSRILDEYFRMDLVNAANERTCYMPIGVLVWLGFFHGAVCLALRKNAFIIPLFTLYSVWLTLMAGSPSAYGLRYLWVYALFVPVFIMYPKLVNLSQE